MSEDEQLKAYLRSHIDEPEFRAWLRKNGVACDVDERLNQLFGGEPAEQRAEANSQPPPADMKGMTLKFVPTEADLKRLKSGAREIAELTGRPFEIHLAPGIKAQMAEAKLDARLTELFGE